MKLQFSSLESAMQAAAALSKHYSGDGIQFTLIGNQILIQKSCQDMHHALQICRLYGGKMAA